MHVPIRVGYGYNPQIISWMTKVLVFYPICASRMFLSIFFSLISNPIAAIFALISVGSLIPSLLVKTRKIDVLYPAPLYSLFSLITAVLSWVAFFFMIGLFGVARTRFHRDGFSATLGPCALLYPIFG